MDSLDNIKVDALGGKIFLPEEIAYVKAVLRQNGMYPCAGENIILCPQSAKYVLNWRDLPCGYENISFYTDGHINSDTARQQTIVLSASYFVAFGAPRAKLSLFAAQIVVWRPYAKLWDLAKWLRREIAKRS